MYRLETRKGEGADSEPAGSAPGHQGIRPEHLGLGLAGRIGPRVQASLSRTDSIDPVLRPERQSPARV